MKKLKEKFTLKFLLALLFLIGSIVCAGIYNVLYSEFLNIGLCLILFYFGMELLVDDTICLKEEK